VNDIDILEKMSTNTGEASQVMAKSSSGDEGRLAMVEN